MSLSHVDENGKAQMVDVGHKPSTSREALAEGYVLMAPATLLAIANDQVPKGEVLAVARVAGIMAAKQTGLLIPLCHPLPIDSVAVDFDLPELPADMASSAEPVSLRIKAIARINAKTGVEMEALTAVCLAALTVYDMCKAIDKTLRIEGIRLLAKSGGTHGDFVAK